MQTYYNKTTVNCQEIIKGETDMPTSSITKDFVVRDGKAYKQLLNEIEDKPLCSKRFQSDSLEKGLDLLGKFSFKQK